ncbi:MAG: lysyl endopeptidase, partial [Bacteroidales bacterium]|nr:lysyl endopeptidase [Bacteroidales bacterium]
MTRLFILLSCLFLSTMLSAQQSYGGRPDLFSSDAPGGMLRVGGSFFIDMPRFDVEEMLREDSINQTFDSRSLRYAKKFQVNINRTNAGVCYLTANNTTVWRIGIRSRGAYSLNVLFSGFRLPEGAKMFLYNADQSMTLGAFTAKNNRDDGLFPVAPVAGDELIVEYHEPDTAAFTGLFTITEVNHDYINVTGGALKSRPSRPLLTNTCHSDQICRDDLDNEAQAVVLLSINGNIFCTGSLLNNTSQDAAPYLLTSCHCLEGSKPYEETARTVVVFFNYQSPTCNSDIRGVEEMSMASATLRAADKELDLALLELDSVPPEDFRPYYLGWNIEPTPSYPFMGIHQPNGGVKKVTQSNYPLTTIENYNVAGYHFLELYKVQAWNEGTT